MKFAHNKLIIGLLFLLMMVAGCSAEQKSAPKDNAAGNEAYTVVDYAGNKVQIPHKPQRILCDSYTFDALTLGIVPPSRLAAINYYATDPEISVAAQQAQQVPFKLTTPGEISLETIMKIKPDLIIASDWSKPEMVQACRELGYPVVICKGPTSIEKVKSSIKLIAEATGEVASGQKVIAEMDRQLQEIDQTLAKRTDKKPVGLLISMMTSYGGTGSMYDSLCSAARITNGITMVGLKNGEHLSKELVVAADPDFFFISTPRASDTYGVEKFQEEFLQDPALKGLKGLNNIKPVPDRYLYSASQNCVYAVKVLANYAYGPIFDLSDEHLIIGYEK